MRKDGRVFEPGSPSRFLSHRGRRTGISRSPLHEARERGSFIRAAGSSAVLGGTHETHRCSRWSLAAWKNMGCPHREAPASNDGAVDSHLVVPHPNNRLQHLWGLPCRVRVEVHHRAALVAIGDAYGGGFDRFRRTRERLPPIRPPRRGRIAADAIRMFGRNLRTSGRCAASLPISPTVAEVITEMLASSKMPRLRCIISTGEPWRRPTSVANSWPNTASSSPSGVRTCVGRFPSTRGSPPLWSKENQLRKLGGGQPGETAAIVSPTEGQAPVAVKTVPAQVGDLERFAAHGLYWVPEERLYFTNLDRHLRLSAAA